MTADLAILQSFESIRTPLLDSFFLFITRFGEEIILLPLLCVVYWCFNKRQAIFLAFTFMFGLIVNHALKITFMIPRPWIRWPDLSIVDGAAGSATGYSFPSGHTAGAVSAYGGMAVWYRKNKKIWIAAIIMIALVGLSRVYLGVHTLTDVMVSILIGAFILWLAHLTLAWVEASPENEQKFVWIMVLLLIAAVAYTLFKPYPVGTDDELKADGLKTIGALCGMLIGWRWEKRSIRFNPVQSFLPALIVVLVGLAGIFAIRLGLKSILNQTLGILIGNFLRYFLIGFWIIGLYPFLFSQVFKQHLPSVHGK